MQQQTDKTNIIKNKRLKYYLFFEPKKQNPFNVKFYKLINLDNNLIPAFNEYKKLKQINDFKLIMFDNCIFNVTLIPEIFNNYKLVI